jgi:hypothetical protein
MKIKNRIPEIIDQYKIFQQNLSTVGFLDDNLNTTDLIYTHEDKDHINEHSIGRLLAVNKRFHLCKTILIEEDLYGIELGHNEITGKVPFDNFIIQYLEEKFFFCLETSILNQFIVFFIGVKTFPVPLGVLSYQENENISKIFFELNPEENYQNAVYYSTEEINQFLQWEKFSNAPDELIGKLKDLYRWVSLKRHLLHIFVAIVDLINNSEMELEEHKPSKQVIRMLQKRGREVPEPYYTCNIKPKVINPVELEEGERGKGVEHGYRYDVRGHQRTLSNGNVIWVKSHQRGIKHDNYVQKKYKL